MFTGIVEELASVTSIEQKEKGVRFTLSAKIVMDDLKIGDSLSVNGVCLTVTERSEWEFCLDLVPETLEKSNLGELKEGDVVNLERAMKLSDRLGGHILQGHVETIGVILEKQELDDGAVLLVGLDPEWMRYCIPKGSIALDGVSLTIAKIENNIIEIALIPHTLEHTTLGQKIKSDTLNVETDIIGKYIERLIGFEDEDAAKDAEILQAIRHVQYGES
ncbi:MAG: riboflavin synthase [Candidatus Marinimicrobia bacterium]|jgi:riboflavin synthase|nr:riboflavin synthase [Candidatus Neomarinimicrobiota bacterium]MDP6852859.1 riboflavin synthase [Candidatus Neomarinimicrobiota bacterium]MDP6936115.1 riboflavin synthase [Candidatus Neomarinimicrobiota bacterium]